MQAVRCRCRALCGPSSAAGAAPAMMRVGEFNQSGCCRQERMRLRAKTLQRHVCWDVTGAMPTEAGSGVACPESTMAGCVGRRASPVKMAGGVRPQASTAHDRARHTARAAATCALTSSAVLQAMSRLGFSHTASCKHTHSSATAHGRSSLPTSTLALSRNLRRPQAAHTLSRQRR